MKHILLYIAGSVVVAPALGAVISHDAVVGFPESVPSTTAGSLYLKYKPYLKVFNGCVPFPAVDPDGNTSGGLATSGASNGQCEESPGQVYVRSQEYNGSFAILYGWYFPKDSPSDGLGHRHDWEDIVIWLSEESETADVLGMSVSQHGDYEGSTDGTFSGDSPLAGYTSYWPVNHQMIFTEEMGGQQPLIAWDSLTDAAREALNDTDFGDANVPFNDAHFEAQLAAAAL